jgi:hypothetical protein
MPVPERRTGAGDAAFWLAFVPSVVLLALVLLAARFARDQAAAGATVSLCVSALLLTPALVLYVLRRPGAASPYWLAYWTGALLAYLAYLFWALIQFSGGDLSELAEVSLGVGNALRLLLAVWWTVDVLLALAIRTDAAGIGRLRSAASLLAFAVVAYSATVRGQGLTVFFGVVLVVAAGLALLIRLAVWPGEPGSPSSRVLVGFFGLLNRLVPWHWLPKYVGALNLEAFRDVVRQKNLYNTRAPAIPELPVDPPPFNPDFLYRRSSEGTDNDLTDRMMGAAHTRFGRNVPLDRVFPEPEPALLEPSPRIISNRLLARPAKDGFVPATTLNLLAAAWIQFMTHDWFHHGTTGANPFKVPLDKERGDTWQGGTDPMLVRRTPPDPTRPPPAVSGESQYPPTYLNDGSHWWDGSQIYGNNEAETRALRSPDREVKRGRDGEPDVVADTRGELRLSKDRLLPIDPATQQEQSGLTDNWWLGLSLMHTLFAQEHNAIAARLRLEYPFWDSDRLFHTARLINVGLMAKIHTAEWTPAILSHPTLDIGMHANWSGLLGEHFKLAFGRVGDGEMLSGIPGSTVNQHGAPYCLTEEFVSVYRMHPLMPDSLRFHRARDGRFVKEMALPDLVNEKVRGALDVAPDQGGNLTMDDVCYSFGITHPGAVVLHNFPNFLRDLRKREQDGTEHQIDLAAIDILRDRERGVPRYNDFRELFHKPRVTTFEQITSNPEWARELREVYGDVNRVDLMVGLFAEDFPQGFGFSDTAFRVFVLMASRRLKSDRFFTTDYTPDVYTPAGLDWINTNTMSSVVLRHFPAVAGAVRQVKNAFAPWPRPA